MATEKEATETTPTEPTESQQQETKNVGEPNGEVASGATGESKEAGKEVEKGDGDAQDAEAPEGTAPNIFMTTSSPLYLVIAYV
jgi:hypothetical protein